jgi:DNA-binding transcriptional regulator YdaS (Cro superfamily)
MVIFEPMKKLVLYLKGLPRHEQIAFAERCGTTVGYLRKACSTGGLLREKVCSLIEAHSTGAVTRVDLRPDDWWVVWPELKRTEGPASGDAGMHERAVPVAVDKGAAHA